MPFTAHLAELRRRLIVCLATLALTTALAFLYANPFMAALQTLAPPGTLFVQLSPGEVFLASFKLSLFSGLGLALPVLLYHVFRFITPGLEAHERKYITPVLLLGVVLFAGGLAFGYWVILPLMLDFLLGYGQTVAQNQLSIAAFLNFCTGFLFASGLVFQLPLLLLLMSFLGLVSSKKLLQQWKWSLVLSFFLGAVITPSADPFSQVVMAGSLFGLYGLSILLIKAFRK